MIRFPSRVIAAFLGLGLLAGCSSEAPKGAHLGKLLATTVAGAFEAGRSDAPAKVVLTPESFAKITVPMIQANPVTLGGSDFLQRAATRRDSEHGTVEIWKSSDNAQIFLRNGVVVGTRGVGRDIIAAGASVTISALQSQQNRRGKREFTISDGDVTTSELSFDCTVTVRGGESITVVNQRFDTVHLQEECVSDQLGQANFRNEYWVQPSTGIVRKSRQWVGPAVGYFELVLLKN